MDIRYSRAALKSLRRSDKRILIASKIEQLVKDPDGLAGNIKALRNRPEVRLRVQNWRVLYRVEDDTLYIDAVLPRSVSY